MVEAVLPFVGVLAARLAVRGTLNADSASLPGVRRERGDAEEPGSTQLKKAA